MRRMVPGLSFCLVTEGSIRNPLPTRPPGPWDAPPPHIALTTYSGRTPSPYRLLLRRTPLPRRLPRPCRPAPAAQGHALLGEDPVDEPVRPPRRQGQCPDGLPCVIAALQVRRHRRPVRTGHPAALLEFLGHLYLPPVRWTTH